MTTTIFVLKERAEVERRVAATPETVRALVGEGFAVVVEEGAGERSFLPDEAYREAGASIASGLSELAQADVVVAVQPPGDGAIAKLKDGAVLIGFLDTLRQPERVDKLRQRNVTVFALDMIARSTRAQPLDALTSQATVAGYLGIVAAANRLPKMLPLLMLAAGVVRPARVVVVGSGVAGLQAVATARRLGAVVEACDVRPKAREEVESLGARFLDVPTDPMLEDPFGYAREVSAEFLQRQQSALAPHVAGADVLVTSARVPGKDAPHLISEEMVASMRPGSVIIDLASDEGGNCALRPPEGEEEMVTEGGVVVLAPRLMAARAPIHASQLYATNVQATIEHLFPLPGPGEAPRDRTAAAHIDGHDALTFSAVITHAGQITNEALAALLGTTASWPSATTADATAAESQPAQPAAEEPAPTKSEPAAPTDKAAKADDDAARNQEALASDDDEAEATRTASRRSSRTESSSPEEDATERQSRHPEDEENAS